MESKDYKDESCTIIPNSVTKFSTEYTLISSNSFPNKIYELNEYMPLLGLEYCMELVNAATSSYKTADYYCVLCAEIFHDEMHLMQLEHQDKYIEKHFHEIKLECFELLSAKIQNLNYCSCETRDIIVQIYRNIEVKKGLQKMNLVNIDEFKNLKNNILINIENLNHYNSNTIPITSEDLKKTTNNCIQRCLFLKPQWKLDEINNNQIVNTNSEPPPTCTDIENIGNTENSINDAVPAPAMDNSLAEETFCENVNLNDSISSETLVSVAAETGKEEMLNNSSNYSHQPFQTQNETIEKLQNSNNYDLKSVEIPKCLIITDSSFQKEEETSYEENFSIKNEMYNQQETINEFLNSFVTNRNQIDFPIYSLAPVPNFDTVQHSYNVNCHICNETIPYVFDTIKDHCLTIKHTQSVKENHFINPIEYYYKNDDLSNKVYINICAGEYIYCDADIKGKTLFYQNDTSKKNSKRFSTKFCHIKRRNIVDLKKKLLIEKKKNFRKSNRSWRWRQNTRTNNVQKNERTNQIKANKQYNPELSSNMNRKIDGNQVILTQDIQSGSANLCGDQDPMNIPITFISVLRLLSVIDDLLGNLGSKTLQMLGQAAILEMTEGNKQNLIKEEENLQFLIIVNEKLKGLLDSKLVDLKKIPLIERLLREIPVLIIQMNQYNCVEKLNRELESSFLERKHSEYLTTRITNTSIQIIPRVDRLVTNELTTATSSVATNVTKLEPKENNFTCSNINKTQHPNIQKSQKNTSKNNPKSTSTSFDADKKYENHPDFDETQNRTENKSKIKLPDLTKKKNSRRQRRIRQRNKKKSSNN